MATTAPRKAPISVYARWRPLAPANSSKGELVRSSTSSGSLSSVSVRRQAPLAPERPWTSAPAFTAVFNPGDENAALYDAIVAPAIPRVMRGGTSSFFAYGHSGSGKTHTIIGYDYDSSRDLGLCLAAARQLFDELHPLNQEGQELGVGFSLFELRKRSAFDLLNRRTECHIREGADGRTHIRGETEVLEDGRVRVCPVAQRPCWTFDAFRRELVEALSQRAVGSSSVHDLSSRTHAVLALEIVNQGLVDARQALIDRQSELVPVGKRATDISIDEQTKSYVRGRDGGWMPNPEYQMDQARIDAAEAEKAVFEARVAAAEEHIQNITQSGPACMGARMVFVDLAGAEYHQDRGAPAQLKQTPQERQEGRQINSDLLALKEVMRAWAGGQKRIPYRSSALTMVLREHFESSGEAGAAMIVTVSPSEGQYAATLNSLKYGSLVGVSGV